jgi:hypothetical protein
VGYEPGVADVDVNALAIVISDPEVPLRGGLVLASPVPYVVSTSFIESPLPKN